MKTKITIDCAGNLRVNGSPKFCPFSPNYSKHCGNWCALFRVYSGGYVNLCHGAEYSCDAEDFTDEREKE